MLVVWSANGDGSAMASSKVNLNDDTYQQVCATVNVSPFRQKEQGIYEVIDLLEKRERALVKLYYKFGSLTPQAFEKVNKV